MASGSDEKISGSKIEPLESETKHGVTHDLSNRGAVGHDVDIDKSRTAPLGGAGQGQNPLAHADSQDLVGLDRNVEKAKIDPLGGQSVVGTRVGVEGTAVRNEEVDAARI